MHEDMLRNTGGGGGGGGNFSPYKQGLKSAISLFVSDGVEAEIALIDEEMELLKKDLQLSGSMEADMCGDIISLSASPHDYTIHEARYRQIRKKDYVPIEVLNVEDSPEF